MINTKKITAMKRIVLFTSLALSLVQVSAQDRSGVYTNLHNRFLSNPSLAGEHGNIYTVFNFRSMINGLEGMPRTYNFSVHSSLQNNTGLGMKVLSLNSGAFQTINAEAAYSKKVFFTPDHSISFGLSLGVVQTNIKPELLNGNVDLSDQTILTNDLNKLRISTGAGLTYRYAKKAEIGIAFPMLVAADRTLNPMMVSTASWTADLDQNKEWKLKPVINYFHLTNSPSMADLLLGLSWKETLSIGGGYRSNGTAIISAGFNFKSVAINYSFYNHTSDVKSLAPAQNEFAIAFQFNKPSVLNKKSGSEHVSDQTIQDEIDKVNDRLNSIMSIEKTNPGFINVKKEIGKVNKELDRILKKYSITNVEQLKKIKELQNTIDVFIAKYTL